MKQPNKEKILSHAELLRLLHYKPRTGLLTWKVGRQGIQCGAAAGSVGKRYVDVKINQRVYRAHRVIWFYMTGHWPVAEVDHRDGNGRNNKWTNLREASRAQNAHNAKPVRTKKHSLLKGVTFAKRGKWQASIRIDGKLRFLGYFDSEQRAHSAYVQAAKQRSVFARAA